MSVAFSMPTPATQSGLDFPQPLTEKYRPEKLGDFIGIPQAKREAAAIISRPVPNSAYLFAGESGTGKTTMALAIAKALNAQLHHLPARRASKDEIDRIFEAVHYTTWTGSNWHVVIADEWDLSRIDLQQAFLSILDSTAGLSGALLGDWQPHPPQVIWIFTTNADPASVWTDSRFEPRFLSRVRIVPFSNYGIQRELAEYLRAVWNAETDSKNGNGLPNFPRIAKELRGNVRACLMALEQQITRGQYATA